MKLNPLLILGLIAIIVVALGLGGDGEKTTYKQYNSTTQSDEICMLLGEPVAGNEFWSCYPAPAVNHVNQLRILACLMFGPCTGG